MFLSPILAVSKLFYVSVNKARKIIEYYALLKEK